MERRRLARGEAPTLFVCVPPQISGALRVHPQGGGWKTGFVEAGVHTVVGLWLGEPVSCHCPAHSTGGLAIDLSRSFMAFAHRCLHAPHLWASLAAHRFNNNAQKRAASAPGPGSYNLRNAVSAQVSSVKASAPNYGFGTSDRSHRAKVYMGAEYEKGNGAVSPGPGAYTLANAVGKQPSSRMSSSYAWGFGTASRSPKVSPLTFTTPGATRSPLRNPPLPLRPVASARALQLPCFRWQDRGHTSSRRHGEEFSRRASWGKRGE